MKKLLLLLCALLTGVSGAWAADLNLTPANGTYVTSSGNYVNSISFSTTPAITVTASANNMDKRQTSSYLLWHSGQSSTCTYTISVGSDYVITGYTVTGEANTSAQTLTAGAVSHEFAVGTSSSFTVSDLKSSSVSFVQTGDNGSGLKITSISVTVVKPTSEQTEAYNTVQSWITTIQDAKGLVTDAANYVSNAKFSAEGSYAALLDKDYTTYFHGAYGSEGPDEDQYLQATLPSAVNAIYFYFKKRSQNNNNRPTSITISGSNDGSSFTDITTINSGLPTDAAVLDYASSKISLGASYQYIRFTVTATNNNSTNSSGHVFFTFSEFYIFPSGTEVDNVMNLYSTLAGTLAIDYTSQNIEDVTAANTALLSTVVDVTYNLYESDGTTLVTSEVVTQEKNSAVSIPSSLKSIVSSYEANDYDYATSGTIGTENCTITVTRTLKSDTYAPSLPSGFYLSVGSKATSMTAATSASDNAHWYIITQSRDGESAIYDKTTYTSKVYRAATTINPTTLNNAPIADNEKYLVRFFETGSGTGLYNIQFANGNYITSELKTAKTINNAGTYAFYKVTSGTFGTDYTFGWNKDSNTGSRVDNNGVPYDLSFWGSGTTDGNAANNVWTIYPVEFVSTVEIAYTLTDENGATYSGTYRAEWNDDATNEPNILGAYGATLSNQEFSDEGGVYSFTADIAFNIPVSSNSVNKPTAIKSALGNSLWYANDGKVIADNAANTIVYDVYADNYRWYIIPVFSEGTFTFKLYNVGAGKYIPNNPSTAAGTATTLTADAASAGAFQYAHYNKGNGFYDTSTSKFLTINTSDTGQNIWLWAAPSGTGHMGSAMSFPELVVVSVSDAFAALKAATKFDILDGSTVMGPSEFAAPASINAAIDAAQEVADNNEAKLAFIESDNGKMIQNYLTMNDTYGPLANIQITMSKEYGTMILPCPCTRIDGLDIYSCNAQENGVLTLTSVAGNYAQNVPYIIHATEGSKYTIIGWDKRSTATHTSGWLTGVLNGTTDIPVGSYMLATKKETGVQAFYKVSGEGVKCAINKCYLTVPPSEPSGVKAFFFAEDSVTTSIEDIFGDETEQGAIYNLAGQRLSKMQKGINIINGKKVLK